MQTKIKSSGDGSDAEKGLVVERRFTSAGQDPFDSFDWIDMDVEIRNPDGSMADSIEGVKLPSGFSGVPGKVCAQKYLRKAGVPKHLRSVPEDGVPVWLQRSEPDHERLQSIDAARMGGETDGRQLSSVDSQGPGPTGAGSTATSQARQMPVRTSMRCAM
tara:strand:- start:3700 stop:4179 length:480 start_codon:yes stop_codon:yes gene_type:complete